MIAKCVLAVTLLSIGALQVQSYGTGAPKEACVDLRPQHGDVEPQTKAFPYTIKANATKIRPSETVRVTISSDKGLKFKGFLIQARIGDVPYGSFLPDSNVKLFDCPQGKKNTATHTNSDDKSSVTLLWVAPPKLQGSVRFTATVAENGGVFWVAQKSQAIRVIQ